MKTLTSTALAYFLALALTGPVYAQTDHGHGQGTPPPKGDAAGASPMHMAGDHGEMMRMMQQMHSIMMETGSMPMSGGQMMRPSMGHSMMREPMATGLKEAVRSVADEFDTNGDDNLTLEEFERLHGALIRERMVDRFQLLDADGDGIVTPTEMGSGSGTNAH